MDIVFIYFFFKEKSVNRANANVTANTTFTSQLIPIVILLPGSKRSALRRYATRLLYRGGQTMSGSMEERKPPGLIVIQ